MLNFDVSGYDAIHIIPLGNAKKQQSIIKACRKTEENLFLLVLFTKIPVKGKTTF
jgi:hypothetical protein